MHLSFSLSLLSILLSITHATNIPITVGADAKLLAFNPQVVTANIGDTLTFSYFPKNHSVVQSSFTNPRHPLANGLFSSFQPLYTGPGPVEFIITVNDTRSISIYCAQTAKSHSQNGMATVVNQPYVAPQPPPQTSTQHPNQTPTLPQHPRRLQARRRQNKQQHLHPFIASGVFVPLTKNSTSTIATGTASTFSTATVYTSISAKGTGFYVGFSSGASYTRSSSSPVAIITTADAVTETVIATQTVAVSSCY